MILLIVRFCLYAYLVLKFIIYLQSSQTKLQFHSLVARPLPASGLFRSSQSVTPSQAQIRLKFCSMPADRAIIPQAILKDRLYYNQF